MDTVKDGWIAANDVRPPEGWSPIVAELLECIAAVIARAEAKITVRQIKEKLGELRVYYQVEPQELRDQIDPFICAAVERSRSTCSICGADGGMQNVGGWVRPLCDRHLG